ncbi:MAG TPA: D-alanine--D-alanine ligase [Nocardioides sp.]|uniref:D-alanine--D-alanine ligase family protein n=1 Tax=Nocardioides sp. TaxID=35761 RepID=UPI002B5A8C3F|nr:D-alanine--D-alanine ligase [Nocardioides sp.]HQR28045.1 D-alanine--D-alanine ligase [Nocardioides sp.]
MDVSEQTVLVLAGGLSHERDVSLRSGRRVAEALRGVGVEVVERDVDAQLFAMLREEPPGCVVPMLHGDTGEDGSIREVLELLDLPYVGAPPAACRAAFDKPVAKAMVTRAGLSTPPSVCLPHETFRELGAAQVMAALVRRLGLPMMVKPAKSGSALGCTVVHDAGELPAAMVNAFAYGDVALLERFVTGTEVAVPVLDDGTGPRALPAVAISPDGGVYDYTARYTAGATEFVVPAPLETVLAEEVARVALTAHQALGLRDVSRSDLIVDPDGTVWFLEVNVAPGFTETSTVPLSIQAAGLELGAVCASLVSVARSRRVPTGGPHA